MRKFIRAISVWNALILSVYGLCFSAHGFESDGKLILNGAEIEKIISHGPWPPKPHTDASNRSAAELGKLLFFDPRLSKTGQIACSTCHDPELGWSDGKTVAGGLQRLDRNTQSLFNVSGNRWFGWDGRNDSLWAHGIGPILDEKEMGATPEMVASVIRNDENLTRRYQEVFGVSAHGQDSLSLVVDLAKSLAAFQETIISGRTSFDEFRDALARRDFDTAKNFSTSAQRGAAIFVGRGKCNLCHIGPRFTNDEFDDVGIPYFTAPGRVDSGRFDGIRKLRGSPFSLLGTHNDAPSIASGWATEQVAQTHRTFGQFKVPSLRQLTQTAPYMHNGSLKTLKDVVTHYSEIDLDRIHSDAAPILAPLNLTTKETNDLVTFLQSLSTPQQE